MASGLYSTFYSIGQILAPTIGGALYDSIGYKSTCDLMFLMCLLFSGFYFVFNVGVTIFQKEALIKMKMQKLKASLKEREEEDDKHKDEVGVFLKGESDLDDSDTFSISHATDISFEYEDINIKNGDSASKI